MLSILECSFHKWTPVKCCLAVLCLFTFLASFVMYYQPDFHPFTTFQSAFSPPSPKGYFKHVPNQNQAVVGTGYNHTNTKDSPPSAKGDITRVPNQNHTPGHQNATSTGYNHTNTEGIPPSSEGNVTLPPIQNDASGNHHAVAAWTGYNHSNTIQLIDAYLEPPLLILVWWWPFGHKFTIKGCQLTDDRSLYNKAHAVIIHHRNIDLKNMPPEPRPRFQKWVWFNMESPDNSVPHRTLTGSFNLTASYRLDSDIPVPYLYLAPADSEDKGFKLPVKNKLVCWVVSNWNPRFKRVRYYNELKRHVSIETYGRAFSRPLNDREFSKLIPSCKFYLSFENSVYRDYITEKLYNPMARGTVPIVLGSPRTEYENHVPGDSFIHVDDFSSPKELAERLLYLDQNPDEYRRYFNWRQSFQVKPTYFGQDHGQRSCDYLQTHRDSQTVHDLNKWFWG